MPFIFLEGLDRTGKTSVAEHFKGQGFTIVHFNAPDKKYIQPGYAGPSYLDECLELYMKYTGQNVVFDRSPYGEFVWPTVYGRKPLLTSEDIEILREIESTNDAQYFVMYDQNLDAHWKRCVDNKEPLSKSQFLLANRLFDKLASDYNFDKIQLFDVVKPENPTDKAKTQDASPTTTESKKTTVSNTSEQAKLEKANAINSILALPRILKKSNPALDEIENEIRGFLKQKMAAIFNPPKAADPMFNKDEIQILKLYCQRINEKVKDNGGKR